MNYSPSYAPHLKKILGSPLPPNRFYTKINQTLFCRCIVDVAFPDELVPPLRCTSGLLGLLQLVLSVPLPQAGEEPLQPGTGAQAVHHLH